MKWTLFSLFVFAFWPVKMTAQAFQLYDRTELNTTWSFGYSIADEMLPEGYAYSPYALFGQLRFARLGPLDIYAESQFARVGAFNERQTNYEAGLNAGLSYELTLFPFLTINAAIGSGPYFITVETRRQARGFIFSDNFELGFSFHPEDTRLNIQLRGRYRHISNAGLKNPNGGIDNFFLIVGISNYF